jgi:hypothetical protein
MSLLNLFWIPQSIIFFLPHLLVLQLNSLFL